MTVLYPDELNHTNEGRIFETCKSCDKGIKWENVSHEGSFKCKKCSSKFDDLQTVVAKYQYKLVVCGECDGYSVIFDKNCLLINF